MNFSDNGIGLSTEFYVENHILNIVFLSVDVSAFK